jgi:ATP-dependent DNA helicase DinG
LNPSTFSPDDIDESKVAELLGPKGPLPLFFSNYECRSSQIEMAKLCVRAFNQSSVALIEAGTGTGKSFAYLLPSLIFAAQRQKCIVISTHTVLLQEQLSKFDIPKLLEVFDLDVDVAIAKGMRHYLCIKKLEELNENLPIQPKHIAAEIQRSLASLHLNRGGNLPKILQTKAQCEKEACSATDCPHYKGCFFFKAKKAYMGAKIIITNHTLLALDAKCREEKNAPILPDYDALIIDEAHHLDAAFTKAFARHFSEKSFFSSLAKIAEFEIDDAIVKTVDHKQREGLEDSFEKRVYELDKLEKRAFKLFSRIKERLTYGQARTLSENVISKTTLQELKDLSDEGTKISLALQSFIGVETLDSRELDGLINRFAQMIKTLKELTSEMLSLFFEDGSPENTPTSLFWIEKTQTHHIMLSYSLVSAEEKLGTLFENVDATVLTSATLKVANSFSYFQKALGLEERKDLILDTFDSPFNYASQARLYVPTDLPEPADPNFLSAAYPLIKSMIISSKGGAFILFTSKEMLGRFSLLAEADPDLSSFNLLVQGEKSRLELLDTFKTSKAPVLLGTSSFWEGVDVAGTMRLLVLMKLPFPTPSDPLFAARSKQLENLGKSSFAELSLPKAILRFKQGFGRLIRSTRDYGCILCLDKRLISRGYGKQILKSLPNIPFKALETTHLEKEIKEFFKNWSVTESNR